MFNHYNLGSISKIVIRYSDNASTSTKIHVSFGNEELSSQPAGTYKTIAGKGEIETFTNENSSYGFFRVAANTANLYFTSLEIFYEGNELKSTSINVSELGLNNGDSVNNVTDTIFENGDDYVKSSYSKGTGNNEPKYYTDGASYRMYGGNTFTISSSKINILYICIVFGTGENTNTITCSNGTFDNGFWSDSELRNQVTFTISGTSGNRRINKITVFYYDATLYAEEFLNTATCSNGVNPPSVSGWSTMSSKYTNSLFEVEQDILKSANANENGTVIEQALARYHAIQSNYSHSTYNDFLGLNISNSNLLLVSLDTTNTLIPLIIIISSLSVGFFFTFRSIKRHKEE